MIPRLFRNGLDAGQRDRTTSLFEHFDVAKCLRADDLSQVWWVSAGSQLVVVVDDHKSTSVWSTFMQLTG
ncbi:MAG TPA: hypothetical protein DCQ06_11300 [Myxococcales bacterium]|nr:hypothetical protein [Myxococcales bacterium]